jgi:hypothetical protein
MAAWLPSSVRDLLFDNGESNELWWPLNDVQRSVMKQDNTQTWSSMDIPTVRYESFTALGSEGAETALIIKQVLSGQRLI